jgi:hypothetical protein
MKKLILLLIAIPVLTISCNTQPRGEVRDNDSGMEGRSYDDVRDRDRTDTEDRTDQPGTSSDEDFDQPGTRSQTDQSGTRSGQGSQTDQTGTMRQSDTVRPDTSDAGGVGTIPR